MEGTRTTLWLFLLLNQLLLCSTAEPSTTTQRDQGGSSVTATQPSLSITGPTTPTSTDPNCTCSSCLIDSEMGLIAIGSAGGLIVCLLIATVVLACQVCQIQRRVSAPRTSRSNMDLVSGTSYWDNDRPEVRGLVGPCDASVMLEEVREESNREKEMREVNEEVGRGLEEGATAMVFEPEEMTIHMQSPIPRDSCLVIPRDLEDMPLVVWGGKPISITSSPTHVTQDKQQTHVH